MPPTKPTLFVFDMLPAIMPTRNDPSCSPEEQRRYVRHIYHAIDNGELYVWVIARDVLHDRGLGEPYCR